VKLVKSAVLALVVTASLVLGLVVSPTATAADQGSSMTIYVVPAITDEKILPTTSIPSQYVSSQISIVASPGEYEPASFVIRANEDIASLTVVATDLTGAAGSIASTNVDIRVVKCWYQAGTEHWDRRLSGPKALTPELLLKDDSLVRVDGGENYLKLTSGQYVWISQEKNTTTFETPSIQNFAVKDSSTLQPVNISSGTNKQFWVTVEVPSSSSAGIYSGRIQLSTSAGLVGEIELGLRVLPIVLSKPYLAYGLTYFGEPSDEGSVSPFNKNLEQYRKEIEDQAAHGAIDCGTAQGFNEELGEVLAIRNELGMNNQTLFYDGLYGYLWGNGINTDLAAVQQTVADLVAFTAPYGVKEIYIYAMDEPTEAELLAQVPVWEAIHRGGAKVYTGGGDVYSRAFDIVGTTLDLYVWPYDLSSAQAAKWHSVGHKILSYGNPQTGVEKPATYRSNYGLLLWQKDYDGAMDFAYQWGYGSIWNDFDNAIYRDEVMAYPTIDGVIDTIEWEGWREGVDDVRYLTTLLKTIQEAKASGRDASAAEGWLTELKASDLATKDLDAVRAKMVDYILSLTAGSSSDVTPPVITSIANSVITSPSVTATVTWTTDERASSQVEYGKTSQLGLSTALDTNLLYSHSVTLTGLDANSTYYFRVKSKDASGNLTTSGIQTLSTTVQVPSSEASLVGYWSLNENSGSIAYDKSTYGNNGTLKNGPQWTTGKFSSALSFDGVDDYVDCGSNSSLDATNAVTIEAWVKTSKAGWNTIALKFGGTPMNGYWLGTNSGGKLYMFIYNNGSARECSTGAYISDGAWHHVAGIYDGTTMACYVDGEAVYTKEWGSFMAIGGTSGRSLYISSTGSDRLNGLIDEVRIWSGALSPEEVKASYSSNTSVPSLVPGDLADVTAPTDNLGPAGNGTTTVDSASQPTDVKSDDQTNTAAEIPDVIPPSDPVSDANQTETNATPQTEPIVVLAGSEQPARGTTNTVIITGANMGEATAVSFGPGITVNSFTVHDPNQVTAQISIARNAVIGARDITITTPDGYQTLTGFFTVVKEPSSELPSWAWVLIVLGVMAFTLVTYVPQRRKWVVALQVRRALQSQEGNEGAPATRLTEGCSRDDIKRIDS